MKTEIRFTAVICADCGLRTYETVKWLDWGANNWIGHIRVFRCAPCRLDYVLLFDDKKAFKTVFCESSSENFIHSPGHFQDVNDYTGWQFDDTDFVDDQDERPS